MKIAFDIQPIMSSQKTGIGFCTLGWVNTIISNFPENQYILRYFSYKCPSSVVPIDSRSNSCNYQTDTCHWMHSEYCKLLWSFFPIPYHTFFHHKADINLFFNYFIPPFVGGIKIVTVHDMSYKEFPHAVRLRTRWMLKLNLARSLRRADHIIVISEFSKQQLLQYHQLADEKITVVSPAVDTNIFHPNYSKQSISRVRQKYNLPENYFLYLGTLEPRKNLVRLIQAYGELRKMLPNAPSLVLAGRKGWLFESIFEVVTQLNVQESVIFTDYIEDSESPLLLNGATAFVFPSLYEGFGMPPLEAMACGAPVLTSNCSSLPEVVGDAAILVDPFSVEEIALGMKQLATDASLRQLLIGKGLVQAQNFTWDISANKLMHIFQSLVKE